MKRINVLMSATLIALTAMSSVGVASATAETTALCTADENPCAIAHQFTTLHEVSVGKATILTGPLNVECDVLFSGTVTKSLANPLVSKGNFTYSNCNNSCVVKEQNGPATLIFLKIGHETAEMQGEWLVHVGCSPIIDCNYVAIGLLGTVKGPLLASHTNGETVISDQTLTKEVTGTFLCPKTSKLDIVFTPLTATYISS